MNPTALQYLLAAVVGLPLLGAVAALLPAPPGLKGRNPDQAVLRHGVTVTGVVLAAALALAAGFDRGHPARMQATTIHYFGTRPRSSTRNVLALNDLRTT